MFRLVPQINRSLRSLQAGDVAAGVEVGHSRSSASADGAMSTERERPAGRKVDVEADAKREYEITPEDLPLSCPMPQMPLWSSHPRVYLPIEETGWAMCPYCAAEYFLRRNRVPQATPRERAAAEGASR
jgi:uncharacterized Zn-finger protein